MLSDFLNDQFEIDQLISNLANTLRHVDNNFSSRLSGHLKMKREITPKCSLSSDTSNIVTSPSSSRSRRCTMSSMSLNVTSIVSIVTSNSNTLNMNSNRNINTPNITTPNINNYHPSISSSLMSYCVLLPTNIFRLDKGNSVIVVIGFQQSIRDCINEVILLLYLRTQFDLKSISLK